MVLETLAQLVFDLQERLRTIDKQLAHWHYTNDFSNQLETIPGIGLLTASALVAHPQPKPFDQDVTWRPGSDWCRSKTRGGKTRLGGITKQGNRYLGPC